MSLILNCTKKNDSVCRIRNRIIRRFRRLRLLVLALIDILIDDPTFLALKHQLRDNPNIENFIRLITYIRSFFNRENRLFDRFNFYFDANIVFADDNNVPIISFDLIKPLNGNLIDTLNNLNRGQLIALFERYKRGDQVVTPPERFDAITCDMDKRCKTWKESGRYFVRYTPGSVSVTFNEASDLFITTSQDFQPILGQNQNAFIIAVCGQGGDSAYSNKGPGSIDPSVPFGGGGSGGFILTTIRNQVTINNIKYTIKDFNINIQPFQQTKLTVTYASEGPQTFKAIFIAFAGQFPGESSPGMGGDAFNSFEGSVSTSNANQIFYSLEIIRGANGGSIDQNGFSNGGPSSGSGIDTEGSFFDPVTQTYNYPNGAYGNPPFVNLTLPGSLNVVTSQGGGKTVPSSGYGSGGGTTVNPFIVDGVNIAPEVIKGRPGYCQIMSTYIV